MNIALRWRCALAVVALSLSGLLAAAPAQAKAPDRLASLTISIWLEYDQPGALYIYHGQLPAGTSLPAQVAFRLPAQPSSTAAIDDSGQYHYIRPLLSQDGDTVIASYDAGWPQFQLEYYADALQRQGASRRLDFVYRADYAVEQLVLEVKEPYGATNLSLDPADETRSQAEDGLLVHRHTVGPVAAGQEVRWGISYTKSDNRLASEALGLPTPSSSAYEAGPGVTPPRPANNWLMWGIVGVVGVAVFGGLGLILRANAARPARPVVASSAVDAGRGKAARRRRRASGIPEPPQVRVANYCYQCGSPLSKIDRFCRKCGAPRRGAKTD